jgi:hypothetical protein
MRLSMARRTLASLLMCWLPLASPEGRMVHGCGAGDHGMAGHTAGASEYQASARHVPVAAAAHAGHVHAADEAAPAHHSHHTPEPLSGGSPAPASHCDCVGTCCPATLLAPRTPATLHLADIRVVDPAVPGRPAHAVVASWVDFVLPFATAPPVPVRS